MKLQDCAFNKVSSFTIQLEHNIVPGTKQDLTFTITREAHVKGGFGITPKNGILFVDSDDFRSLKKNRTSVVVAVYDARCNQTSLVNVTIILKPSAPIMTGKGNCSKGPSQNPFMPKN
jgi:hypothetical protein